MRSDRTDIRLELIDRQIDVAVGAVRSQASCLTASSRPPAYVDMRFRGFEKSSVRVASLTHSNSGEGLDWSGTVFAVCIAILIVTLYASVLLHWGGPRVTLFLISLPVGLGVIAGTIKPRIGRDVGQSTANTRPTLTRAEQLYGAIQLDMAAIHPAGRVPHSFRIFVGKPGRASRHAELALRSQCEELLAKFRVLERQRIRLQRIVGDSGSGVGHVQAEREELSLRHAQETDPMAREALGKSVALCDARLENLNAMRSMLVRIDAYEEMICQSLSLIRSAIARSQAAPHVMRPPAIHLLEEGASRLSDQTRSLEEAIAEIAEL